MPKVNLKSDVGIHFVIDVINELKLFRVVTKGVISKHFC